MSHNTTVKADHNAPPVTKTLANFIVNHPSYANGGWDATVQHEGVRTFFNWLGCAVGAAHHDAPNAALAAAQVLQPAPQATLLGRSERVDIANARLRFGGGTIANVVFRGKVHIGYLAAIVAASNAGGSGSVVGDTTTTMMWIAGVKPLQVFEAYVAAVPALLFFGSVFLLPLAQSVMYSFYKIAPGGAREFEIVKLFTIHDEAGE